MNLISHPQVSFANCYRVANLAQWKISIMRQKKNSIRSKKTVLFAMRTIFPITLWQGKAMQRTALSGLAYQKNSQGLYMWASSPVNDISVALDLLHVLVHCSCSNYFHFSVD